VHVAVQEIALRALGARHVPLHSTLPTLLKQANIS
jgi:hypothetical protein